MTDSLVLTIIGRDRPGLVESVARVVSDHDGNWLESRMAQLGGQFAGILRVTVPAERADALERALRGLDSAGLDVVVSRAPVDPPPQAARRVQLELLGHDRPGIVREISTSLAAHGVNVSELWTECRSAPMSGEMLFAARVELETGPEQSLDELRETLERIAHDLMVDITLDETPESALAG